MVSKADRERLFGGRGGAGGEPPRERKPPRPAPQVVAMCGHTEANRACFECRKARAIAHAKRRGEKAAARRVVFNDRPRLPDGSSFNVTYCGETQTWGGTLSIHPEAGSPVGPIFSGSASGLFQLLTNLDDQYRQWLKDIPQSGRSA